MRRTIFNESKSDIHCHAGSFQSTLLAFSIPQDALKSDLPPVLPINAVFPISTR